VTVVYEPALTAVILAGVVGGVAVVLGASSDWEVSSELARATLSWSAPLVTRSYDNDSAASRRLSREAVVLRAHGYRAVLQRGSLGSAEPTDGRHVVPGTPSDRTIVVTYART
jgi:hypothetical protein